MIIYILKEHRYYLFGSDLQKMLVEKQSFTDFIESL